MKKGMILMLIATGFAWLNLSCNKEHDELRTKIKFDFALHVNGAPFELDQVYDIEGTSIYFKAANFYVGGIIVYFENGDSIDIDNQYLLGGKGQTASLENKYKLSTIESVQFWIGVDSITNNQSEIDFTRRPDSDPLSIKDPSMHWNWNTGYKFVRFDGDVDSDGDGTFETPVSYHLGGNDMFTKFDLQTRIPLVEGTSTVVFDFDVAKFFSGVDLSTEFDTHTFNNLPLAQRLRDNLKTTLALR